MARIKATPPWADFDAIKTIYAEAQERSDITGVKHNVDHDIPLQHPDVCGLHVADNLVILTEAQNNAKRNKWSPGQLGLFGATET